VTRDTPARSGNRAALWIIGGGVVFTGLCLALSAWLLSSPTEVEEPLPVAMEPPPTSKPAPVVARAPVTRPVVRPVPSEPAPRVEEPVAVQDPPPTSGPTGVGLYQRGTKPLKIGLVVPEGFPLPPGYMRHYQATDDGERVAPILMFHPDYQPLDANGQPIALPENRVVPAELAPPGMPLQMLELAKDEAGNPP
jgi:hypothetical protein